MSADNGNESGRWPPKRCEMPDLSNLSALLTVSYMLNRTLGNTGLQMSGSGQYQFLNLIRLVDKTLLEYGYARDYLQQYVDSDNKTRLFFRCTDHMENCVDSLRRSFFHIEELRLSLNKGRDSRQEPLPQLTSEELPRWRTGAASGASATPCNTWTSE
jgi:hypothetical protein